MYIRNDQMEVINEIRSSDDLYDTIQRDLLIPRNSIHIHMYIFIQQWRYQPACVDDEKGNVEGFGTG